MSDMTPTPDQSARERSVRITFTKEPPTEEGQQRSERKSMHRIWCCMKHRCGNPDNSAYKHYGARGIRVCDRWLKSFETFCSDMGPRPSLRHSIDRIDNDGNYEPGNCRWATRSEQARNTRRTISVAFRGDVMCLKDWAAVLGIPYDTIKKRLRMGWAVERALSEPVQIDHTNAPNHGIPGITHERYRRGKQWRGVVKIKGKQYRTPMFHTRDEAIQALRSLRCSLGLETQEIVL